MKVIARLEGAPVSRYCALWLLQATLDESLYELAGELVCKCVKGNMVNTLMLQYEPTTPTDSDKLSPRFLGLFLFPSSYRKQSTEARR